METATEIALEVEATDPVGGVIRGPDGERQPFTGWLQAVSTIERILGSTGAGDQELDRGIEE